MTPPTTMLRRLTPPAPLAPVGPPALQATAEHLLGRWTTRVWAVSCRYPNHIACRFVVCLPIRLLCSACCGWSVQVGLRQPNSDGISFCLQLEILLDV